MIGFLFDCKSRNLNYISRRGARFDQTVCFFFFFFFFWGGGQALFINNALPLLSIFQAKRGAAPVFIYNSVKSLFDFVQSVFT